MGLDCALLFVLWGTFHSATSAQNYKEKRLTAIWPDGTFLECFETKHSPWKAKSKRLKIQQHSNRTLAMRLSLLWQEKYWILLLEGSGFVCSGTSFLLVGIYWIIYLITVVGRLVNPAVCSIEGSLHLRTSATTTTTAPASYCRPRCTSQRLLRRSALCQIKSTTASELDRLHECDMCSANNVFFFPITARQNKKKRRRKVTNWRRLHPLTSRRLYAHSPPRSCRWKLMQQHHFLQMHLHQVGC